MITAGLVKSETLSLVLLPIWLVCCRSTVFDNRMMWVQLHSYILPFYNPLHASAASSHMPKFRYLLFTDGGKKCRITMQVCVHRCPRLRTCGRMCLRIHYCICSFYLKVRAGSLCWLDLERRGGRAGCRQRRNLPLDTWMDYGASGPWAQTCKRPPFSLDRCKMFMLKDCRLLFFDFFCYLASLFGCLSHCVVALFFGVLFSPLLQSFCFSLSLWLLSLFLHGVMFCISWSFCVFLWSFCLYCGCCASSSDCFVFHYFFSPISWSFCISVVVSRLLFCVVCGCLVPLWCYAASLAGCFMFHWCLFHLFWGRFVSFCGLVSL